MLLMSSKISSEAIRIIAHQCRISGARREEFLHSVLVCLSILLRIRHCLRGLNGANLRPQLRLCNCSGSRFITWVIVVMVHVSAPDDDGIIFPLSVVAIGSCRNVLTDII